MDPQTTRRQSKDALERLDTPAFITRALLRYVPALVGRDVVEPCAGANAITRVLTDEGGCRVAAFDIEPRAEGITQVDTMKHSFFKYIEAMYDPQVMAIVTNTPFSLATDYWRRTQSFGLVALLVRITWLEACANREDVRDPDALIIVPRTKFAGPGAIHHATGQPYTGPDSTTVCWAIWSADPAWLPVRPIVRVNRREKADLEAKPPMQVVTAQQELGL